MVIKIIADFTPTERKILLELIEDGCLQRNECEFVSDYIDEQVAKHGEKYLLVLQRIVDKLKLV